MNKVILIGRIAKNLELKKTTSGVSVIYFPLAVNRRYKQEGGQEADFINCVAWNKTADIMFQYLKKGSKIAVEGRIETRSYDNREGKTVYITEVIVEQMEFLETKSSQENRTTQYQTPTQSDYVANDDIEEDLLNIPADDLPF